MVYNVIGLMSGSSLDGLDIAYVQLTEVRGKWDFSILNADCIPYSDEWQTLLKTAHTTTVSDFLKLNTSYGRYIGEQVMQFITRHQLQHKVHFIASHGHTVFHDPSSNTTFQIGDGASIAAICGLPVINDLRAADVALGGQGAPIVPIGDKLLFADYTYLLNLGGIANLTVQDPDVTSMAFDVCPANQLLNALAARLGKTMDEGGAIAASGKIIPQISEALNNNTYYLQLPPKSLSNDAVALMIQSVVSNNDYSIQDLLCTASFHIAQKIVDALQITPPVATPSLMLVTGGGAFNEFLIEALRSLLAPLSITLVVPATDVVKYKEALVMALIGALRWREEENVLHSVTGASRNSVGGAIWLV